VIVDPLGGVTITAREIYDAVVRLTGRVDVLIEQHADAVIHIQDHEARIRSLERGRWPLPALSTALAVAAIAVNIIPRL
jgi:hypothetical protein